MHFAPDTAASLEFAVEFANTDVSASASGGDELASVGDLLGLLDRWEFSGSRDETAAELAAVRASRDRMRLVWSTIARGDTDAAVAEVNAMLADARALPRLARHDGSPWHLHATTPDAPLAQRIEVEGALALVDVIRSNETGRLRVCAADDCAGLLVDLSRNGSKRYCSVRCGNRMNQLAFRERRQAGD
ncbi:CGNR zinc finger domain-containing protein [Microbacterium sp.]|uniref:CGNR zinc finger domain-containing protein n=1 Tax=Microbacterium sp. TaxID=51671 RepID=UPI003221C3EF